MGLQKRTWLLVLFLLALVGAIAFHIVQISQTEKGYALKTENLYPISFLGRKLKYGYVNQAGQLIIQPQFDDAKEFSEGFAPVKVKEKWGFVNLEGQVSISPQYEMVGESSSSSRYWNDDESSSSSSSFSEGLAGAKLNGKWGFINQSGKLVIPYQYDKIQQFSGGVATVQVNGFWGVIKPEGKWIIQPVYKSPIEFFQGIANLKDPNTGQIISYGDKSGQLVGDLYNRPQLAKEFQEELAIIEIPLWSRVRGIEVPVVTTFDSSLFIGSKCGFQDKQGKVIIKPQFDGCRSFSQGLAAVRVYKKLGNEVNDKWGYIDKTGKFVVSPRFDYADSLFEERGLVVSNGKIGFIDKTGKIVVKPEFEPSSGSISSDPNIQSEYLKSKFKKYPQQLESWEVMRHRFANRLAVVGKDNKCGYIDKTGKFAILHQFIKCEQFDQQGVAKVIRQSRFRQESWNESLYINREGKTFPELITSDSLSKFYPARIKLLASVMACLLWIVAISCHEFGHAIVAYWGGDFSVKDKGYLSFDPRRYINPLHSIILPAIFLVTGGIALPGAAVYIEFDQIRNRLWSSATAAAGPIASILFGLLLVPVFHFSIAWNLPHWLSGFIAFFISLQFFIVLFNLLPIPPLDGYRIIAVWLPYRLQDRSGMASLIGLFFICFLLPFIPIANPLFNGFDAVMGALGISNEFVIGGWYLFDRWYTALPLLVAGLVYLIYKPASTFQLAGLVLENFSPKVALKMYESAIKIDPKSAWSWERKAWTLNRVGTLGDYVERISAWEEAIKLDPHNRFSWRSLILELRVACIFDKSYDQQLIEALKKYTESYPKDGWGWGVKALNLEQLGNDEEALLAWEKNIRLDPSDRS
ncbi:WG repeat-containing protein [Nostoc sp.]|uniref:WG repeat-containing protein n=1 Tax=Nostoc sp. TaxID=1180 RepID=UPI002FF7A66D